MHAVNTGKAVWNYGGHRESGNVILVLNWYRKETLLDRFTLRNRLRFHVAPGEFYDFLARTNSPDREGRFIFEVAVVLTQDGFQKVGASQKVQVKVGR